MFFNTTILKQIIDVSFLKSLKYGLYLYVLVALVSNDMDMKGYEETDRTKEQVYSAMVTQSVLAATLKQIYTE